MPVTARSGLSLFPLAAAQYRKINDLMSQNPLPTCNMWNLYGWKTQEKGTQHTMRRKPLITPHARPGAGNGGLAERLQ